MITSGKNGNDDDRSHDEMKVVLHHGEISEQKAAAQEQRHPRHTARQIERAEPPVLHFSNARHGSHDQQQQQHWQAQHRTFRSRQRPYREEQRIAGEEGGTTKPVSQKTMRNSTTYSQGPSVSASSSK